MHLRSHIGFFLEKLKIQKGRASGRQGTGIGFSVEGQRVAQTVRLGLEIPQQRILEHLGEGSTGCFNGILLQSEIGDGLRHIHILGL